MQCKKGRHAAFADQATQLVPLRCAITTSTLTLNALDTYMTRSRFHAFYQRYSWQSRGYQGVLIEYRPIWMLLMDSSHCRSTPPRGIRVIVCDLDDQRRASLEAIVKADPVLVLASSTGIWEECKSDLDSLLPELLIVRSNQVPATYMARCDHNDFFPLVITVREHTAQEPSREDFRDLLLPLNLETARRVLDRAVVEIYTRKVNELSDLVSRYIAGLVELRSYSSTITVERDGQNWDLNTRSILAILAARKCVWINSLSGRFMLRKPIHHIAANLDPSTFFRINRSIIVNRRFVDSRATLEDRGSHVVLTDGSRYVVGLNYRDSITRLLKSDLSLEAA